MIILDREKCYGCGACEQICPTDRIIMSEDEMGFYYPMVLGEKECIFCEKCVKVCPINNIQKVTELSCKSYMCQNKNDDVLKKSSSGGIFFTLAEYVIKQKGAVFGAAYDKKHCVYHKCVETIEDIDSLCRSKYVQSKINDCFYQVVEVLKENRKVLFVGTPCQVAACYNFSTINLEEVYLKNLYLVDIVCGSVSSPRVYKEYLDELIKKNDSKIISINQREKDGFKWSDYATSIIFENGKSVRRIFEKDCYMRGFTSKLYSRESCYSCGLKSMNSQSDITIGDLITEEKKFTVEQEKGYSVLILKTKKGKDLFDNVEFNFKYEYLGLENMYQKNRLWIQHKKNKNAELFKTEFLNNQYTSLEELIWKNLTISRKPGIEELNYNFVIIGGWNSRAVLRKIVDDSLNNKMIYHISKSSIISMYGQKGEIDTTNIKNVNNMYRFQMICNDINKKFRESIKDSLSRTNILILDFMEEANSLLCNENNHIITESDALLEYIDEEIFAKYEKYLTSEEERMDLWKKSCDLLFKDILSVMSCDSIILLKMFLTEKKGHNGIIVEEFDNLSNIRNINNRLNNCYMYVTEKYPNIKVVELNDPMLNYTDIMHKYGCIPNHLNDEAYNYLADEIYKIVVPH